MPGAIAWRLYQVKFKLSSSQKPFSASVRFTFCRNSNDLCEVCFTTPPRFVPSAYSCPSARPARPLAPRGGIWRNPNPFSYYHTFTLPQFHIFTFPTAARSTVRRRGHSRLPRGGFSKPDISATFGMRRLLPPPTPYPARTVENVIISPPALGALSPRGSKAPHSSRNVPAR